MRTDYNSHEWNRDSAGQRDRKRDFSSNRDREQNNRPIRNRNSSNSRNEDRLYSNKNNYSNRQRSSYDRGNRNDSYDSRSYNDSNDRRNSNYGQRRHFDSSIDRKNTRRDSAYERKSFRQRSENDRPWSNSDERRRNDSRPSYRDRDNDYQHSNRHSDRSNSRYGNRVERNNHSRSSRYQDRDNRALSRRRHTDYQPIEQQLDQPDQIQPQKKDEGAVRLNKYIANAGVCSRREADILIATGVITINGEVITQLGYKVMLGDVVKYNGRVLNNEKKVYLLLNKPKGFITTSDDPKQRKTVLELIHGACSQRLYPVGRLDRNTTGLLLLTNDGDLTKKLTHPSYGAQKVYNVDLDKPVKAEDLEKLINGVELEDGEIKVDDINYLNNVPLDKTKIGVSIHSGRNRIIRRMFEALGYEVKKLDRVYFAGLTKKNLLRGQYRFLDDKEIGFLHMQ